jgi:hypothetical protein
VTLESPLARRDIILGRLAQGQSVAAAASPWSSTSPKTQSEGTFARIRLRWLKPPNAASCWRLAKARELRVTENVAILDPLERAGFVVMIEPPFVDAPGSLGGSGRRTR